MYEQRFSVDTLLETKISIYSIVVEQQKVYLLESLFVILSNVFLLTNMFTASGKYKRRALQKRPLHPIFVVVHKCNLRLGKQESQLLLGCADRRLSLMSEGQRPTSGRGKKAIFQSYYSLIHAMVALLK